MNSAPPTVTTMELNDQAMPCAISQEYALRMKLLDLVATSFQPFESPTKFIYFDYYGWNCERDVKRWSNMPAVRAEATVVLSPSYRITEFKIHG